MPQHIAQIVILNNASSGLYNSWQPFFVFTVVDCSIYSFNAGFRIPYIDWNEAFFWKIVVRIGASGIERERISEKGIRQFFGPVMLSNMIFYSDVIAKSINSLCFMIDKIIPSTKH